MIDSKWKEIKKDKIKVFQLDDEPELIYVITVRDDEYMVVHEDPFGLETGTGYVEFFTRQELKNIYDIDI